MPLHHPDSTQIKQATRAYFLLLLLSSFVAVGKWGGQQGRLLVQDWRRDAGPNLIVQTCCCLLPAAEPAACVQANGAAIKGGTWFETGAEMLGGGTLNYFAVPWAVVNNPLPLVVVTAIEVCFTSGLIH